MNNDKNRANRHQWRPDEVQRIAVTFGGTYIVVFKKENEEVYGLFVGPMGRLTERVIDWIDSYRTTDDENVHALLISTDTHGLLDIVNCWDVDAGAHVQGSWNYAQLHTLNVSDYRFKLRRRWWFRKGTLKITHN